MPDEPQTVFVWQVAVDKSAQGMGVGRKMLRHLLDRDELRDIRQLKTTITAKNQASWALFSRLARLRGGELSDEPHYKRDHHFDGEHETEHMVTIRFPEKVSIAA
jgi:L-2,4-diaminobutyric acid acetyltransferase